MAAYSAALLERTSHKAPLEWDATLTNLSATLWNIGKHESGMARLEAIIATFRTVVLAHKRDEVPLEWAARQHILGAALQQLGERESSTVHLEEAVDAYRAALLERARDRVPFEWAETQSLCGDVLRVMGERQAEADRDKGCVVLREARQAIVDALEVHKEAKEGYYVEKTQRKLAEVDASIARLNCGN